MQNRYKVELFIFITLLTIHKVHKPNLIVSDECCFHAKIVRIGGLFCKSFRTIYMRRVWGLFCGARIYSSKPSVERSPYGRPPSSKSLPNRNLKSCQDVLICSFRPVRPNSEAEELMIRSRPLPDSTSISSDRYETVFLFPRYRQYISNIVIDELLKDKR